MLFSNYALRKCPECGHCSLRRYVGESECIQCGYRETYQVSKSVRDLLKPDPDEAREMKDVLEELGIS